MIIASGDCQFTILSKALSFYKISEFEVIYILGKVQSNFFQLGSDSQSFDVIGKFEKNTWYDWSIQNRKLGVFQ